MIARAAALARAGQALRRVEALLSDERLRPALALCEATIRSVARQCGGRDVNLVPLLESRGVLLTRLSRFRDAAECYRKAASLLPARTRDDELRQWRRRLRRALGEVLISAGDYQAARVELEKVLGELDRRGVRGVERALTLNDIGIVCKFTARFDRGRALYREALAILRSDGGSAGEIASVLHNLGGIEHAAGDYRAALPFGREALDLVRATHGPEELRTADEESALASLLVGAGELDEAEALLEHTIHVYGRRGLAAHYEVAVALHNLGDIAAQRGMRRLAVERLERAARLKRRLLGDGPDLGLTVLGLASLLSQGASPAGRRRAIRLVRSAERMLVNALDADHPHVLGARALRRSLAPARRSARL